MSFNPNPQWTRTIILPDFTAVARCPECNQLASNVDEITSVLRECTYYEARHIPPSLIFTCSNSQCPRCDIDFYVLLALHVTSTIPQWSEQ